CTLSVVAESRPQNPWVGLLARKERIGCRMRFAGRSTFPDRKAEWLSKRHAFTHSGGTAPDLHRTSPLCPPGHPRQGGMLAHSSAVARRPDRLPWHGTKRRGRVIPLPVCGKGAEIDEQNSR